MNKDPDTAELKPEIREDGVVMNDFLVGGCFVDFRTLHRKQKKEVQLKYRLFPSEAIRNPLFYDPY